MTSQPHAGEDGGDRLSALPDCLLHAIMSLLPARHAVQTCALSRRWRDLWLSMPCLDIVGDEFTSSTTGSVRWDKFESFATNLLLNHDAPFLDRFRLRLPSSWHVRGGVQQRDIKSHSQPDVRQIERWINRGVRFYRPVELEITIGVGYDLKLPILGAVVFSHRLKSLRLSRLVLDRGFGYTIRSWCPVLEAMELNSCIFEFDEITGNALRSLAIDGCSRRGLQVPDDALCVTAPKLTSLRLKFSIHDFSVFLVDRMGFLVDASICKMFSSTTNFGNNVCNL